ncbi:hypothetical protein [Amycolatopsis sp.]|uniref:hypothetical protein n=1 Tax=Amycolatopsis sp. TaxID=37632 RepID=UPI002D7E405A|nr:hypothetical protein [Amycolatopsis sp.]HET6710577.1 hypothetical protein [Amycolatopsis sp.]
MSRFSGTDTVPEQGISRLSLLAITTDLEHGWMLVADDPKPRSPARPGVGLVLTDLMSEAFT